MQEIFPDVMLQNVFSSTMILGEVPQRQPLSEGDLSSSMPGVPTSPSR
jgi:hypothetical protein